MRTVLVFIFFILLFFFFFFNIESVKARETFEYHCTCWILKKKNTNPKRNDRNVYLQKIMLLEGFIYMEHFFIEVIFEFCIILNICYARLLLYLFFAF